ncbi:hypothetical protein VNI00_000704 [Paramarasmius palmivorus]|uniref:Uncharacterized protein n=1 Tax=Paramarasmius palmivorus TaxID=297713 RepID=A0AAW0E8V2_9AGAR
MESWSIAVLGSGCVGKTALTVKFVLGRFPGEIFVLVVYPYLNDVLTLAQFTDFYDPTVEDFYKKDITIDDKPVNMKIIDTGGQEDYSSLLSQQIGVNSRPSYNYIDRFRDLVKNVKGDDAVLVLVGNKCDLQHGRQVPGCDGISLAESLGCCYFETSTRTGENVDAPFVELIRALREKTPSPTPKKFKGTRNLGSTKCTVM